MNEEKLFDNRLIERHITQGRVTKEEYEAYLKSLKDSSEKSESLDLVQPIVEQSKDQQAKDKPAE